MNDFCYLLESAEGPRKLARYSFIGFSPTEILQAKDGKYQARSLDGESETVVTGDPTLRLREIFAEKTIPHNGYRLLGGLVGYFSYDAVRYIESLPSHAKDDLRLPDFEFGLYNDGIVFDHSTGEAYYYWYDENRLQDIRKALNKRVTRSKLIAEKPESNIKRQEFCSMVKKAKRYILSGDIFQTVLSKRFGCTFKGDLANFYEALRKINPSPYMYFLKMREREIIGSSPEMLVRVEGKQVETFPIAGTRPVGANSHETERLASELLKDPKERAEHVMLVDLARNDVGKVSKFGSVKVPEFMVVQRYSHVQHIVSRVTGELAPGRDAVDAFRAVFPAGTVSGAPKKRAMEIIDELEPTRRGPYAGAVGYLSYNGNADFAITIRTLVANGSRAYVQAGAGIVADSEPNREWLETEHKARALLHALRSGRA